MRYLSSAYYSNMHTLSETGNTIENLLKYAPDISWNNKGGRDSSITQRLQVFVNVQLCSYNVQLDI